MSACGPYTVDENLDYLPFDALCEEAKRTRPDVLVLVRSRCCLGQGSTFTLEQMGPFVDERHPMIKMGDVDDTPPVIFATHISSRLRALISSSPSTQILLIPSVRDLISKNAVFPQGPYDRDPELELPKVRLFPLSLQILS